MLSDMHSSQNQTADASPSAVPVVPPSRWETRVSYCDEFSPPKPPSKRTIPTAEVWGTHFAQLSMKETLEFADEIIRLQKPEYFVTANLNYLMLTEQVPALSEVNAGAAAVLADGHPIVARSRFSSDPLPCRVAGADLIVELAQLAAEKEYRVFFLGGAVGVAKKAAKVLKQRFPSLQIAGCLSPPYRKLTSAEHDEIIGRIRAAQPHLLLVALGQPKGELWIYENLQQLQIPLSIQLGASFDFLAGTSKRSPRIWQRLGCEWLHRAASDPLRLVPRYSRNGMFLLRKLVCELLCWR